MEIHHDNDERWQQMRQRASSTILYDPAMKVRARFFGPESREEAISFGIAEVGRGSIVGFWISQDGKPPEYF